MRRRTRPRRCRSRRTRGRGETEPGCAPEGRDEAGGSRCQVSTQTGDHRASHAVVDRRADAAVAPSPVRPDMETSSLRATISALYGPLDLRVGRHRVAGRSLCSPAASSGASHTASCSTHGLAVSGIRVVGCTYRASPARRRATVAGSRSPTTSRTERPGVRMSGAQGFAMNEESCTGCKTTTNVSIQYVHGKVTVAIRGGSGSAGAGMTGPVMPTVPDVPGGSGTVI